MKLKDFWKQPSVSPNPRLDGDLGHMTAGTLIMYFLAVEIRVLEIGAVTLVFDWTLSAWITFGFFFLWHVFTVFLTEEETFFNGLSDVIEYAFLWVFYFIHFQNYWLAGAIAAGLFVGYYLISTKETT